MYLVALVQVIEIGLDHVLFIVHHQVEILAAELVEPVDDMFQDGHLTHRDQGLGQDLGRGVEPGAQPPRHDHHRQAGPLAVIHIQAGGKDDIRDPAPGVQNGQGVDALFFQHPLGLPPAGQGQADGMVIVGLAGRVLQLAAPQDKLADISVGDDPFQDALGRHKQDPLPRLIQLFHGFQDGEILPDAEFFHFQHGLFLAHRLSSRSMTLC